MENYPTTPLAKKYVVIATVCLIVVLAAVGLYLYRSTPGSKTESVETLPTGEVLTKASENRLVSSFPAELILEKDVLVAESYSINYVNEDLNMPVASFESKLSYSEAIEKYGEYIRSSGWQMVHEADPGEEVTFWYGKKENADLNVTFELREGKTFVSIAYSTSGQ